MYIKIKVYYLNIYEYFKFFRIKDKNLKVKE